MHLAGLIKAMPAKQGREAEAAAAREEGCARGGTERTGLLRPGAVRCCAGREGLCWAPSSPCLSRGSSKGWRDARKLRVRGTEAALPPAADSKPPRRRTGEKEARATHPDGCWRRPGLRRPCGSVRAKMRVADTTTAPGN